MPSSTPPPRRALRLLVATLVAVVTLGAVVAVSRHATTGAVRAAGPAETEGSAQGPAEGGQGDEGHEGEEGEEEEEGEHGPDDWILAQRVTKGGVPARALAAASRQAGLAAAQTAVQDPGALAASWTFVGPTNVGGRVLDIALDPVAGNTIYVATASGGVWKSTDAGATLTKAWPDANPQPIGAIAAASDGTLYAGIGEAGPGGGSITYGGRGIYRSIDGGAHWTRAGKMPSPIVGRILVDPTDPQRVLVAGAGDLFNPGGGRGVYRTIDGGAHWARVLKGSTSTTGAVDLAMDPNDPDVLYAAMWDHIRYPDLRVYGGKGSGIYRSVDGGDTWKRLSNGLPPSSKDIGRIGLAVSPNDPDRLYAIVIATDGTYQGFYRSNDGGDSWAPQTASGLSGSQSTYGWWFGRVWVDPADKNHVFVAGVPLAESTNGGQSFTSQGSVHADQHAMVWDPKVSQRVYLGNDGGVYRSNANGTGGWVRATVQPFTQFYSVDVSEQDHTRIVGGAQDNGSNRSWPGDWNGYVGGDGEETLIDPTDQDRIYGCSQYGSCDRSTNGGTSMQAFGVTVSTRYNWLTPVQFDPSNPQVMYLGGNRLNRSTNAAQSFTVISPDLTGGPGRDPSYPFGTITTVAAATTDPNELLAGTDDGRLWYTMDLGAHWTRATDPDLPGFWVSRVAIDPADADVMYVTYSGYRSGENTAYVLRSADGGTSWSDISGNLPVAPVNDIVIDGASLYVATDQGVYRSKDSGATWRTFGNGLPIVPIDDLELVTSTRELVAATFGRGMWKLGLAPS